MFCIVVFCLSYGLIQPLDLVNFLSLQFVVPSPFVPSIFVFRPFVIDSTKTGLIVPSLPYTSFCRLILVNLHFVLRKLISYKQIRYHERMILSSKSINNYWGLC